MAGKPITWLTLLKICWMLPELLTGSSALEHNKVEFGQIVGQAAEACRHLHTARDQQLTVALPSRPMLLIADPTRLVQILTNLLNNAAKYTENGGQIWLTAAEEDGVIVMRVRDNGIGIATDMLPPPSSTCLHRHWRSGPIRWRPRYWPGDGRPFGTDAWRNRACI